MQAYYNNYTMKLFSFIIYNPIKLSGAKSYTKHLLDRYTTLLITGLTIIIIV